MYAVPKLPAAWSNVGAGSSAVIALVSDPAKPEPFVNLSVYGPFASLKLFLVTVTVN